MMSSYRKGKEGQETHTVFNKKQKNVKMFSVVMTTVQTHNGHAVSPSFFHMQRSLPLSICVTLHLIKYSQSLPLNIHCGGSTATFICPLPISLQRAHWRPENTHPRTRAHTQQ